MRRLPRDVVQGADVIDLGPLAYHVQHFARSEMYDKKRRGEDAGTAKMLLGASMVWIGAFTFVNGLADYHGKGHGR